MLRTFLAALAAVITVLAGCANRAGTDPCRRALDRLVNECGYEVSGTEELETNCTGQSACLASCLEESPCEDIAANKGEFADCVGQCM